MARGKEKKDGVAPLVTESESLGDNGVNKHHPALEKQESETTEEESSHEDDRIQDAEKESHNGSQKEVSSPAKSSSFLATLSKNLFRLLLLDAPLALLFGLYMSTLVVDHIRVNYLAPQLQLMYWSEERQMAETTYYHRECELEDLTATTVEELIIHPNQTTESAVQKMLQDGVVVFPDFMEDDLVDKLREFVLDRNTREAGFWVIEGQHRFSFGIGANMDPSVAEALNKIATHPTFKPFIEGVVGPNPALIEFTAITSMPGAKDQYWHSDVLPYGSNTKHSRSFIPSYSLFIPLQDTTAAMGATQVCPGSHVCSNEPAYCGEHAFQVSGKDDNWKKGTAFVFNQAFHHRGTGHSDFNKPPRATFILTFAPRPQYRPGELETRLISQGGSYSIRWDHWGHTMDDLKEADKAMVNPWLTLRALGVYKPANKDWGWDMVTVASLRITNDDNGYHEDNLEDFLANGGFKYLPMWLQGSMDSGDVNSTDALWYDYLTETLHKCRDFSKQVNVAVLGTFLVLTIQIDIVLWMIRRREASSGKTKHRSIFLTSVFRLCLTHGLIVTISWLAVYRVDHTQWAHQIKSGMLYRVPLGGELNDTPETRNNAKGTLPNTHDVLIPARMNSDYLASYNNFIHVGHPANKEWKSLIAANAQGYSTLPSFMQQRVAQGIVDTVYENDGRFLIQGFGDWGRWVELPSQFAVQRTHRDLIMASNPTLETLNNKLEHLLSETKFGYHQRTALHRVHIPKLLRSIQQRIVPDLKAAPSTKSREQSGLGRLFKLPQIDNKTSKHNPIARSTPPHRTGQEPFSCAWAKEGDIVESMYNGEFQEWYRGTVVFANSMDGAYNVRYDDGEEDPGLCRRGCIRPFEAYTVGEVVEARFGEEDVYAQAEVQAVYSNTSYLVYDEENHQRKYLTTSNLRRFSDQVVPLEVGMEVEARYRGDSNWYGGKITNIRDNGTYDVAYSDGDVENGIAIGNIRPVIR